MLNFVDYLNFFTSERSCKPLCALQEELTPWMAHRALCAACSLDKQTAIIVWVHLRQIANKLAKFQAVFFFQLFGALG